MNSVNKLSSANANFIQKQINNPKALQNLVSLESAPDSYKTADKPKTSKKKILALAGITSSLALIACMIYKGVNKRGAETIQTFANKLPEKGKEEITNTLEEVSKKGENELAVNVPEIIADVAKDEPSGEVPEVILNKTKEAIQEASDKISSQENKAQETFKEITPKQKDMIDSILHNDQKNIDSLVNEIKKQDEIIKTIDELGQMSEQELENYVGQLNARIESLEKLNINSVALSSSRDEAQYLLNDIAIKKGGYGLDKLEKTMKFQVNSKDGNNFTLSLNRKIDVPGLAYIIETKGGPEGIELGGLVVFPGKNVEYWNENRLLLPTKYQNASLEYSVLSDMYLDKRCAKLEKAILKQVVHDSNALGYEGRVWAPVYDGYRYFKDSEGFIKGPNNFEQMYNMGFRFVDDKLNKLVENNPEKLHDNMLNLSKEVMYLSDEAIADYLTKGRKY